MKAVVLHEYGPPKNLKYEDFEDPKPGKGEVLVRVLATSVNPIDWKVRSGAMQSMFPTDFPAILGADVAGLVQSVGEGVEGFTEGDRVFAMTKKTYAELCVVKAENLAKIPDGLEIPIASTVPTVASTGDQLIRKAVNIQQGQTVLITGATGSVGRIAMYCAIELGAKVIAGVRKKQIAEAKELGAIEAIDIADKDDVARIGFLDAVADTVGGEVGSAMLSKVKAGGTFGSLTGPPKGAELHPTINIQAMSAEPDAKAIVHYAEALRDGKLKLPLDRMLPLAQAAEAHAAGEKGGVGKIVLLG